MFYGGTPFSLNAHEGKLKLNVDYFIYKIARFLKADFLAYMQ